MLFTSEQELIKDMTREFAEQELLPNSATWDQTEQFPREALLKMGQLGLMGMLIPEIYAGAATDYLSFALAVEEIAAADGACSTIMSVNNSVVCLPIFKFGSDWHKETILPQLASGTSLGAFCLTEPQAGTDASNLITRAEKKGDQYIINGVKQFITSGQEADFALVFAVTDKTNPKHGISCFIVPTEIAGYQVAHLEKKMGQRASDTAQLVFEDLVIGEEYLLGAEGEGYRIALSNLEGGRIGIAAQAVGMARHALQLALGYAGERVTFGKALKDHQAIAFRLADCATQLEAARALVHAAARKRDLGLPSLQAACMAKLFATEAAEKICSEALQVFGGYGYLSDFPLEQICRDVRVSKIYEGTSDVQRMVIARELFKY